MKYLLKGGFIVVLAVMPGSVPNAWAQRAFNLSIASTNAGAAISWRAQSATPVGDLIMVPKFRVERSPDLLNWTRITGQLTASLNQTMTVTDSNAVPAFYR